MKWRHTIFVLIILLMCTGAGPCDIINTGSSSESESETDETEAPTGQCDDMDISCNHALNVELMLAGDEEFPAGGYTFIVTAPDESVYSIDCTIVRADEGIECIGGDLDDLEASMTQNKLTSILFHINGAPKYCTLEVLYNDTQIVDELIQPSYELDYPNGEGCEPVCYSGMEHLAVVVY